MVGILPPLIFPEGGGNRVREKKCIPFRMTKERWPTAHWCVENVPSTSWSCATTGDELPFNQSVACSRGSGGSPVLIEGPSLAIWIGNTSLSWMLSHNLLCKLVEHPKGEFSFFGVMATKPTKVQEAKGPDKVSLPE